MLTKQELRSLQTARNRMMDVFVRVNCISREHPEWAVLSVQAKKLLVIMAAAQETERR